MPNTVEQDAYQKYLQEKRDREANQPEPETVVDLRIDKDLVSALILLINDHYSEYGPKSQALLSRVDRQLRDAIAV